MRNSKEFHGRIQGSIAGRYFLNQVHASVSTVVFPDVPCFLWVVLFLYTSSIASAVNLPVICLLDCFISPRLLFLTYQMGRSVA